MRISWTLSHLTLAYDVYLATLQDTDDDALKPPRHNANIVPKKAIGGGMYNSVELCSNIGVRVSIPSIRGPRRCFRFIVFTRWDI